MKKATTLTLVVLILAFFVYAYGQKEAEKMQVDPAAELAKSIASGKMLFGDTSLGTSGLTCNSCHWEGGTMEGKMQDMVIPAWDNLAPKYPRYFKMAERVYTLEQVVQFCIVNPLKGKPLAWDDQRLTDLTAYCASVKKMMEKKMMEKK